MRDLLRKLYYKNDGDKYIFSCILILILVLGFWMLGILDYFPPGLLIILASLRLIELTYLKEDVIKVENKTKRKISFQIILCMLGYGVAIIVIMLINMRGYI